MNTYAACFITARDETLRNFEHTVERKFQKHTKQKLPKRKIDQNCHAYLGKLTRHHLIPRMRIRDTFGKGLRLPYNTINIWELRHTAWHLLFKNLTLNEIITLFKKSHHFVGYGSVTWKIVFKERNYQECLCFLIRVRKAVRKNFSKIELNYNPTKHIERKKKSSNKKSPK